MPRAHFVFHGDLIDFLPAGWRGPSHVLEFDSHQTVKHLFESLGVPHVEVSAAHKGGAPVGFDYRPHEGDIIELYPYPPGLAPAGSQPGEPRFILDIHLGRLAAYLRLLGFDTLYRNDYADPQLAEISAQEGRVLLSRDRRLLMRGAVIYGYCLRSLEPRRQVLEVSRRYALQNRLHPFKRCLRCNGLLHPISKDAVLEQLEPLTRLYFDEFHTCEACGQVYWRGSHYHHMLELIEQVSNHSGAA